MFLLTIFSSILVHRGRFENPPDSDFIFFRYHWLWNRMQLLAILKGLAQGYIVTAPAMLVMRLVGQEGALGTIQAVGGILSAFLLYFIGRTAKPEHRLVIFTIGLTLFALGGLANALLFNAVGVLIFMVCLLLGRPLHDIAYFPIQMQVIDTVSAIEKRNKFAYIFNQEFGFFIGRFAGCGLFILLANLRVRHVRPALRVADYRGRAIAFHLDGQTCREGLREIGQVGERQPAQSPIPVFVGE